MHRKLAHCLAVPAVAVMAALGGCRSDDQHVFAMPLDRPGTVTIVDALTGEPLWSKSVPEAQKLVLKFERDGVWHDDEIFLTKGTPANEVNWALYPAGKGLSFDQVPLGKALGYGTVDLPGTPVRVDVRYDRSRVTSGPATAPTIAPESTDASPTPAAAEEAAPSPVLLDPPTAAPEEAPATPATPETPETPAAAEEAATPPPAPAPAAETEAAPAEEAPAAAPEAVDDPAFK